ncbi:MAG TPA: heparan-alpha-glucosaminide N-acetyltransferase domain-containing protein [Candidatus Binatia bacterium]|nr:heparan-alpha-glucosaminide N-acetyltransferase domain-containing protein [Candidatus Binatia bacterium]
MAARLPALDWLRGVVMVLMTVDHASGVLNAGRLMSDSAFMYRPGTPLPAGQFFTRWITHLCAPTFVFLAGAVLALSVARREAAGEPARAIDRFIVTRGLFIAALDVVWMSPVFVPGRVLLQVLYAIGASLIAMAFLRRLSPRRLLVTALAIIVGGEALTGLALLPSAGTPSIPAALLLTGGELGPVIVGYPLAPWLAIMMLGWVFGKSLASAPEGALVRRIVAASFAALVVFAVLRAANGYGNMQLFREGSSLVQWLHVSKYPPSLTYTALELGLMALALAILFRLERVPAAETALRPLRLLGQTALFYYLLHVHFLEVAAWVAGASHRHGLAATYAAALVAVVVLLPLCAWYRGYKSAHPDGWPRYV